MAQDARTNDPLRYGVIRTTSTLPIGSLMVHNQNVEQPNRLIISSVLLDPIGSQNFMAQDARTISNCDMGDDTGISTMNGYILF